VMGPLGGGRLAVQSKVLEKMIPGVKRIPELALRFVLANKNVSLALSGMRTIEEVEENVKTVSTKSVLTKKELEIIKQQMNRLKKMADLYCTGCNYCMPCPQGVAIPRIFHLFNRGRVYGIWENARKWYAEIENNPEAGAKKADKCTRCGACEKKCPQKIPIIKQLQEAHKGLINS
nr:4Fe-4S dicluster domain-containing protein [Victivallales bacterium]